MKQLISIALITLLAPLWPPVQTTSPDFDLIISGGRIVDGTGNPWYYGDLGVRDGKIVEIGRLGSARATRTINAANQIVAPGFIDVHTHVESIYSQPAAENFVRMGVTTLVTGNCGTSTTNGPFVRSRDAIE